LARTLVRLAESFQDKANLLAQPRFAVFDVLNAMLDQNGMDEWGDRSAPLGTSGRTLPWLLRMAGVKDIRTKVHVRAVEVGDPRRTHRLGILDVTKDKILATSRLSEAEFNEHRAALAAHLGDPDTLLIDQLFVQAWGRRPD
jgi:hypothetical protein